MELEKFKKILNLQAEHYQREQKLYEMGLDTTELNEPIQSVVAGLWSEILTEEGDDWVSWYLYEHYWISGEPNLEMKAWDKDKNEIVRDVDELHQYLVDNSCFRAKND